MNKLMLAGAAAVLAVSAQPAMAAENLDTVVTLTPNLTMTQYSGGFNVTHILSGGFSDRLLFLVPENGNLTGSVITLQSDAATGDIDFTSVILDDMFAFTPSGGDVAEVYTLTPGVPLTPGVHFVRLIGTVTGPPASYGGTLNLIAAAPIPEPETWALMLFGFGAVGYSLRRRQSYRFAQAV